MKASRSPQFLARRDELAKQAGIDRAIAKREKALQAAFEANTPAARQRATEAYRATLRIEANRETGALIEELVRAVREGWPLLNPVRAEWGPRIEIHKQPGGLLHSEV